VLIRLSPMTARYGVLPLSRIKPVIGRRADFAADAEQRAEGIERVEAPVKSERELVEVGLKMLRRHAVVTAEQPTFEVAENEVDDGEVFFRDLRIAAFGDRQVFKAARGEGRVARRGIGYHHRARLDGSLDKAGQGFRGAVGRDCQPEATGIPPAAPGRQAAVLLPVQNLDRRDNQRLVVDPVALTSGPPANPRFIDLDMRRRPADFVGIRAHHTGTELVQNLERRLVTLEPELPLKLHRRHAGSIRRDEVGRPKPTPESGVRVRSMTVPAVRPVSRRHFRQRSTPGRLAKRNGEPVSPQAGQVKPSAQRMRSRYSAQAASSGKSR